MLKLFTSSSRPSCRTFRNEFYSSRFLFSSLPNKRILQTFLERKSFIYFPTTDPITSISRFFFYEQLLVSNLFLPEIPCNSIAFFHIPRNSRSSRKFENETNARPLDEQADEQDPSIFRKLRWLDRRTRRQRSLHSCTR